MKKTERTVFRVVITWSEENHMRPRREEFYISTRRGSAFAGVQAAGEWALRAEKPWKRAFRYITSVKTTEHAIVRMR